MMGSILNCLATVTSQVYADGEKNLELQQQFTDQHQAIVAAIELKDPDCAFKYMADHLNFADHRLKARVKI